MISLIFFHQALFPEHTVVSPLISAYEEKPYMDVVETRNEGGLQREGGCNGWMQRLNAIKIRRSVSVLFFSSESENNIKPIRITMSELNIVELIETNPITKLNAIHQSKLIALIKIDNLVSFYTFALFKCVVTVTFVIHLSPTRRRFKCAKV